MKKKTHRSFEEARKFVHSLKLKSQKEWREYRKSGKRPLDIPTDPYGSYKNKGWITWGDWLGTFTIANYNIKFRSFVNARKFARSLNLKSGQEWNEYCKSGKKPTDIPTISDTTYKNKGWKSWGDFLGTGRVANQNRKFRSFDDARKFARKKNLINREEWKSLVKSNKIPNDIPSVPQTVYKNKGWKSWGDFLGTGNISGRDRHKQFKLLSESRKFVRSLGLKTRLEWGNYVKKNKLPNDLPRDPQTVYENEGWKGWGDFLGTGRIANQDIEYLEYEEAERQAHILVKKLGIKSKEEWIAAKKAGKIPDNLPTHPWIIYRSNRSRWKK